MESLSDTSLDSWNVFLQWVAAGSTAIAVFVAIALIFVGKEANRRQARTIHEFSAKAEIAKADAAKANEKAESERLARAKLQASIMPRSFVQHGDEVTELKLFAGTNALIVCEYSDTDGHRLCEMLTAALRRFGWNVNFVSEMSGQVRQPGVIVLVKRSTNEPIPEKLYDAATILTYYLKANGNHAQFFADVRSDSALIPRSIPDIPDHTIIVNVGEKWQIYLNEIQSSDFLKRTNPKAFAEYEKIRKKREEIWGDLDQLSLTITPSETQQKNRIVQKYMNGAAEQGPD